MNTMEYICHNTLDQSGKEVKQELLHVNIQYIESIQGIINLERGWYDLDHSYAIVRTISGKEYTVRSDRARKLISLIQQ